jgi:RNA polymerase sigma factor (sigma-70 family)
VDEADITDLIRQFCSRSPAAAEELWRRYRPSLMRVVRRHLTRSVRRVADSEDFAQAVWKSIIEQADQLPRLDTPEALGAYLAAMATNKIASAARAQKALKRDAARCESLDMLRQAPLASSDPSPSQQAVAQEHYARLTSGLGDAHRRIVDLRLAGHTMDDIAGQLGLNERTVRRVLDRLARREKA